MKKATHPKWRYILPLAILVLWLAVLQAARVRNAWQRVATDAQMMQTIARRNPVEMIQSGHLAELDGLFAQTALDLREFRAALGPLVYAAPLLSWLPTYGGDLANAPALLELGEKVSTSAHNTLSIGMPFNNLFGAVPVSSDSAGAAILGTVQQQDTTIQQARHDLDEAAQARSRIVVTTLSPLLQQGVNLFDQVLLPWQTTLDGLALAPLLLGVDRSRVYLLLMQNNEELRATGGFITAVALLRVDRGQISVSNFEDSGEIFDSTKLHPTPPAALEKYMYAGLWVLRDANWSPDFPTSALVTEALYLVDRGVAVDGVIGVNPMMIPRLLAALGPVTLEGYGGPITAENVISKFKAYHDINDSNGHRKAFLGRLLEELVSRVRTGNFDKPRVARAVYDSIVAKDLLIFINDAHSDSRPHYLWEGTLYHGSEDALMIVDSNVGWNKVDVNIERAADYAVSLDGFGRARATVSITYTNQSPATIAPCLHRPTSGSTYAQWQQDCYFNYVRVVAPAGSQLIDREGLELTAEPSIKGRAIFGGYFVVPRGESRTIRVGYSFKSIPDGESNYILHLEKQPGIQSIPVQVHVTFPTTWRLRSAQPRPVWSTENALDLMVLLDRDQEVSLDFDSRRGISVVGWVGMGCAGLCGGIALWRLQRRWRVRVR